MQTRKEAFEAFTGKFKHSAGIESSIGACVQVLPEKNLHTSITTDIPLSALPDDPATWPDFVADYLIELSNLIRMARKEQQPQLPSGESNER